MIRNDNEVKKVERAGSILTTMCSYLYYFIGAVPPIEIRIEARSIPEISVISSCLQSLYALKILRFGILECVTLRYRLFPISFPYKVDVCIILLVGNGYLLHIDIK